MHGNPVEGLRWRMALVCERYIWAIRENFFNFFRPSRIAVSSYLASVILSMYTRETSFESWVGNFFLDKTRLMCFFAYVISGPKTGGLFVEVRNEVKKSRDDDTRQGTFRIVSCCGIGLFIADSLFRIQRLSIEQRHQWTVCP